MGQTRPLFVYFRPFLNIVQNLTKENRWWDLDSNSDRRMVDADESTEQK